MNRILSFLAAVFSSPPQLPVDNFEPYCDEPTLQERYTNTISDGEHKAIHKIGARYGAEL